MYGDFEEWSGCDGGDPASSFRPPAAPKEEQKAQEEEEDNETSQAYKSLDKLLAGAQVVQRKD